MVLNKILKPILTSFSKDKWQSRNPEVRKKAIQELPVSAQDTLSNIAMNDTDENIRAMAANRLNDLDLLQTIIMKGTNGTVKQAAEKRLFQLLSGLKHPIPEFDVREKMIRGSRNPALLEFVAANADMAELREITIKRISRDPLLGDIALNDNNAQVRQLAAQQIAKRSTLERVAKQSRRKDKRVYKIVKNKLDRIIEDEERPALLAKEVTDICDKLEKLYKRNRLLQEKSTFENYLTRWSEIQNFANEDVSEKYHAICEKIITRIDKLETQKKLESETILLLDNLLQTLSTAVNDLLVARDNDDPEHQENTEEKEKIILNLGREWDEVIKALNDSEKITLYNNKFQAILDLADNQNVEPVQNSPQSIDKIINLTEQAESMTNNQGYIPEKTIFALESKFNQQIENIQSSDIDELATRFNQSLNTLKDRLKKQQQNAQKFITQIEKRIKAIKLQISDGHVSKADKSLHETLKQIDHSEVLSNSQKQQYHTQLKDIQSELGDLSSWRNWAHDNERENLAIKAEKLAENAQQNTSLETEFTDVTAQVNDLRKQWKKLRSRTSEDLWQRFNTACNLAYEQCIPFIDKQSEIRKLNLQAKQALCEQLENYIETMGWPLAEDAEVDHSINWIQVDKITKQARTEWSQIGFVERKEHKSLNQRFDKAIEIIRNELKKVWHINQEQFYQLIRNVQALEDTVDDDLSGAINKAKDYQRQWKTIGPVSSFQRNKLWKKFRKACDVIFERRQEEIVQKNSQNNERLREKEAICENLEALNQQPLSHHDLENAFKDIEKLWKELEPQVKAISKSVNQRYSNALSAYHDKLDALVLQEQQEQLSLIRKKADLCTLIEASSDKDSEVLEEYNDQWNKLGTLPAKYEHKIKQRFDNAIASIDSDKSSLIQKELDDKQHFCLKNEILLGIESPEGDQKKRMELQVELLNSNLGNHSNEEINDLQLNDFELQLQWYEMSDYSQDQTLEERFNQLLSRKQ